jgi:hypothetical protein
MKRRTLLHDPLCYIRDFASRIQRWIEKKCHMNCYSCNREMIIRQNGFFRSERLAITEIALWRVDHEMGFDIVSIVLKNGVTVQWIDDDGTLLDIVRSRVPIENNG